MSNEYYEHLKRDLVQSVLHQLVPGEHSLDSIHFMEQAWRSLHSPMHSDQMIADLLRRARLALVLDDGTAVGDDVLEQIDTAIALFDWPNRSPKSNQVN